LLSIISPAEAAVYKKADMKSALYTLSIRALQGSRRLALDRTNHETAGNIRDQHKNRGHLPAAAVEEAQSPQ
jgi:hypothetical protein